MQNDHDSWTNTIFYDNDFWTSTSERKLRLFLCACCRHVWDLLSPKGRCALQFAERFADQRADWSEYWPYQTEVEYTPVGLLLRGFGNGRDHRRDEVMDAVRCLSSARLGRAALDEVDYIQLWDHIFGSFAPNVSASQVVSLPQSVRALAETVYGGEPCQFALHDALLEAGHPVLAEHFREPYHPKGCWALDLILGKS